MAKKATKTRQKKSPYILRMFRGQVISSDFFARHWLPILIFIIVMMVYITTIEKIEALQKQLEIVQNESSRERSSFMSRIRETSMQQLVDSLGLDLRVQPQPPFTIHR